MNHDSAYSSFQVLAEKEIQRITQTGSLDEDTALAHDLRIVCQLVDSERYTLNDIANALMKGTLRQKITTDPEVLLAHVDRVLSKVNHVRFTSSSGAYKLAQRSYRRHVAAMMNQYRDYSKESYSIFHDGAIALEMLQKEGYSSEVVNTVLQKNSFYPDKDESYFKELSDALQGTLERYRAIASINPDEDFIDTVDMYRKYAKAYMDKTGIKIFSASDEQKIARKIYIDLLHSYESDMPKRIGKTEIDQFNLDMEEVIKPAIRDALEAGSPVATEPGRDKMQYIESVLLGIQGMQEQPKSYDEELKEVCKEFDRRMDDLLRKRRDALHTEKQEILDDCMIAKELLDKHENPLIVSKTISERSQVANGKENPYPSPLVYGKWVVECAQRSLHADREILYCKEDHPNEQISYEELKEMGMDAKKLYVIALAERVRVYPSFASRLSERDADIDACEKLMMRYRDIDRFDLKDAIRELSPRAQLAGIGEDYEERVLDAVSRRIEATVQRKTSVNRLQQEYNRLRGLAFEGILSTNPMNAYKDGKVAVTMLQRNENPDDIREIVKNMAVAANIAVPELYAADIIESAKEVVARGKAIESYVPVEEKHRTIVDTYMMLVKDRYHAKEFPTAEMDVAVSKALILSSRYSKDEIQDVVEAYSPSAAEPGRDRHYKEYAYDVAKTAIDTERTKLEKYKVILRPKALSCESEVTFQRNAMREAIDLPPSPAMDAPIAESLLQSGRYQADEILRAIASEGYGEAYAKETMELAKTAMERRLRREENEKQLEMGAFVRIRSVTHVETEEDDDD